MIPKELNNLICAGYGYGFYGKKDTCDYTVHRLGEVADNLRNGPSEFDIHCAKDTGRSFLQEQERKLSMTIEELTIRLAGAYALMIAVKLENQSLQGAKELQQHVENLLVQARQANNNWNLHDGQESKQVFSDFEKVISKNRYLIEQAERSSQARTATKEVTLTTES